MTQVRLGEVDAGRLVSLRVGDLIHVDLKERPTTGYRWSPTPGTAEAFEIVSDERDMGEAPGAAAVRRFVFRVRGPGEFGLDLVLSRPWASDEAARVAFQISAA